MAILSQVGTKHWKIKILHGMIYTLLLCGSIVMIYPFLIVLSGSTKSSVDITENDIVPRFLYDDTVLYRKYMEALFNEKLSAMQICYSEDTASFKKAIPPTDIRTAFAEEWMTFAAEHRPAAQWYAAGAMEALITRTVPQHLHQFKKQMQQRYPEVQDMNAALDTDFQTWNAFYLLADDMLSRRSAFEQNAFRDVYNRYKQGLSPGWIFFYNIDGYYKTLFLKNEYGKNISGYNAAHDTDYDSYDQFYITREPPADNSVQRLDWLWFARNTLNLQWIHFDQAAAPHFRDFLAAKYGTVELLNRRYDTSASSFLELSFPDRAPSAGIRRSDWEAFLVGWQDPDSEKWYQAAPHHIQLWSPASEFQSWLIHKYDDLGTINRQLETAFDSVSAIRPPQKEAHYLYFLAHKKELRTEFVIRNFRTVLDYILFHGRGIYNTTVYCLLAILAALIVNPMAAYALSRFKLRSTYKVLLFILLTMAFPPMVTQIPVFLMLRDFHLLNTFAALILPGLANGYSIFLLKGFFDSLPSELYETAQIDGAGEWTMFWHITMSLSKPILAVIALNAFTLAYSNFMFALLLCQDQSMWTLMVWLYQLQQSSGQAVMYASLIIAAVPTFLVFFFCQNIIMRGIVIPVEK